MIYIKYKASLVKKSSTVSSSSTTSQASSSGVLQGSKVFQMDQEIMSLFRKLQKKDAITKVKALKSLQNYVEKVGPSYTDNDEYAEQGNKNNIY